MIVLTWFFQCFFGQAGPWRRTSGSGKEYFKQSILRCADHVKDEGPAILRMYFSISDTLVWGFAQMFQKRDIISRCKAASMGSSPSKKYKGTTGECLLSFSIPRRTLRWKLVRDFKTPGLTGSEASSDLRTGLMNTDQTLYWTAGESLY